MEGDGDEEHDEVSSDGNAQGHADEDAVEENAYLQHHALENGLLVLLLRREDVNRCPFLDAIHRR